MTGPLSLIGGMEHRPGCEPIDRRLLDRAGARGRPVVTVVPVATAPRKRPFTIDLARSYWARLGAEVRVSLPRGEGVERRGLSALDDADVIVLPGGDPYRLDRTLRRSEVLDRILDRWRSGVALSGSSAGAIVLAEWRVRWRPPNPFALVPGFAVVRDCVVAPHYELPHVRHVARRVSRRHEDVSILGIGSRSGIVGQDGRYRVTGPQPFTLLRAGRETSFVDGHEVALP